MNKEGSSKAYAPTASTCTQDKDSLEETGHVFALTHGEIRKRHFSKESLHPAGGAKHVTNKCYIC